MASSADSPGESAGALGCLINNRSRDGSVLRNDDRQRAMLADGTAPSALPSISEGDRRTWYAETFVLSTKGREC